MKSLKKLNSVKEPANHSKNGINLNSQTSRRNLIYSIVTLSMLFFSQAVSAQITLKHTFNGYVSHPNYVISNINYYVEQYVSSTNQVKIYKEDFSLYKSVSITPPSNYSISSASLYSKNIFTTDNKITFLVVFSNSNESDYNKWNICKLYNEEGAIVKDFGYAYSFSPSIHLTSDGYRLSLLKYIYGSPVTHKTEIYSLPGTPPAAPVITTNTLPNGMVGTAYNTTLTASGDTPITWSLESGHLPGGLNISSVGVISGTPTVSETCNFTVKATNEAGSGVQELSIFIDEKTGISMLQIADLKIFPNPTTGKLTIDGENMVQNRLLFYDMTGKEVLNQNITGKTEIDISNLQKGIYVVSIASENEVIGNFKIVKQ